MPDYTRYFKAAFADIPGFCKLISERKLRNYQRDAAVAIAESITKRKGLTFVVIFPRQSGKNYLQAHIEAYLLMTTSLVGSDMVKVSPTWKPQSINSMRRLQRVLESNITTVGRWRKESGYVYCLGRACLAFFSGEPAANVVGATASLLLQCDEAQDVTKAKWDKDFAPMAASTNATRVFWGTAWTSKTLLAREERAAREAEKRDGVQRVFKVTADDVAKEVPAYGKFVAEQVARLGRQNPMVKTQYFCEEIDAEGGMFPARRMAMIKGLHAWCAGAEAGKVYVMLVDVAGEDEAITGELEDDEQELSNKGRDSTTMTMVEVDLSTMEDQLIRLPSYKVINRRSWIGVKHSKLYSQLKAIAEAWRVNQIVIDATGVGAGLASFLDRSLHGRVVQFTFNASTKSKLGWDFISVIESGRFKDYTTPNKERTEFELQCSYCQMEIKEGPDQKMKWGVPDGTRAVEDGSIVHDDWIVSAALVGVLDTLEWSIPGPVIEVKRVDPIKQMDKEGF